MLTAVGERPELGAAMIAVRGELRERQMRGRA